MTDFFLQEVGITQSQFNVGQQLLSLDIVLLEVFTHLSPLWSDTLLTPDVRFPAT